MGGTDYFSYVEGVANPRDPKFFIGRRLLIREITNPRIFAAITEDESYNDPSLLIVLDRCDSAFPLDAVMGIMNSRLAKFYHFNSSPKATKGAFPKILITDVNTFPLPSARRREVPMIAKMAREMADRRLDDPLVDLSAAEAKIDRLVCDAYQLTVEQKELVLFYGK